MKREILTRHCWGILVDKHLHCEGCVPALYLTRAAARADAEAEYGYIRRRPDLRRPPHNWRMPRAVRVMVATVADVKKSRPGA